MDSTGIEGGNGGRHFRVLLDSRLQQPLQNGPFPHGDGTVAGLGEPTPFSPAEPFSLHVLPGPDCDLVDPLAGGGYTRPRPRSSSLGDLYTLTRPMDSVVLTVCMRVSVFSRARPAVRLFLVEERC
ncbi:hypothetical protein EYF80_000969 [Liparis tanakae]|uniref:Uncharacterized protein n=1 Tax=Liparis tanakae TaxID=230148 RepID=A0A4Z2JF81_9TELE|nr:hypothetical protein EYF80_000969 [Liparis tanakae]